VKETLGYLPDLLNPEIGAYLNLIPSADGTNRAIVLYPCQNFQTLNMACNLPDSKLKEDALEPRTAQQNRDEMLELFKDFPEWVVKIMKY
jgi:salicylate hydroxylase